MFRLLTALLAAACIGGPARTHAAVFYLLEGGFNLSSFSLTMPTDVPSPKHKGRPGFGVLAGIERIAGQNLGLSAGLGYETRGDIWTTNGVQSTLKYDYVHLPLRVRWMTSHTDFKPYLAPGLDLAYLISSGIDGPPGSANPHLPERFDLGLDLALGLLVPLGKQAFYLEGGYGLGLLNTQHKSTDLIASNRSVKLRVGALIRL